MDSSAVQWNRQKEEGMTKYEIFKVHKVHFDWEAINAHVISFGTNSLFSPRFIGHELADGWTIKISKENSRLNIGLTYTSENPNINVPIYAKFSIFFISEGGNELQNITSFFVFTRENPYWEMKNITNVINSIDSERYVNIKVNMEVRKCVGSGEPLLASDPRSSMSEDYDRLFQSKKDCDIIFLVNGKEFKAHKNILMARCEVFFSMFEADMEESKSKQCKIDDIEPDVFDEFLRFLYTEKANVERFAHGLLKAADKYRVTNLKEICEDELTKTLTEENSFELLVEGDLQCAARLKERAMQVIIANKSLMKGVEWLNLKKFYRHLADETYDYALGIKGSCD